MKARRNIRGLSLIELLVVMVILVVGIFSVARVFPQGFRFLTHARNVTLAGRLAQAEVERWKAYAANVPDGIEAEDVSNASIWTDYNPNDMSNADPAHMPAGANPWYWANVNRVREIKGETTVIPTPTFLPYDQSGATNEKYAYSIYQLKFAPVEFGSANKPGERLPAGYEFPDQWVLIYGDPMPRTDVSGLKGPDLETEQEKIMSQRGLYGIDYNKGVLYFRPSWWQRKFKVDYTWWNGSKLESATEIVTVARSANPFDTLPEDPVSVPLQHGNIDSYSDRVARKFTYVAPPTAGNPPGFNRYDPYEFTLLNTFNALTFAPTIGFNPIGVGRNVQTNLGTRPLTAHIDYTVEDWHILHEDRTVPNPSAVDPNGYLVRLTLPGIKAAGRRYDDISGVNNPNGKSNRVVYSGLTDTLPRYSVVALDMTDNTLMLDNMGPTGLQVDYAAGTVRIPAGVTKYTPFQGTLTGQDIRGHDIRLFYQAVGDWAVQVTKAWSSYQRRDVGGQFSSLQYNTFDVELVPPGQGSKYHSDYSSPSDRWSVVLTFPRSNAGSAISVSMVWNDEHGVPHSVTGRQFELPEFATLNTAYPYLAFDFAPGSGAQAFKRPGSGDEWRNPNFTFVQGASLKARVIWREDPRRWNMRDLETFLSRK